MSNADGSETPDTGLTEEKVKALIAESIGSTVNAAVTSHTKRLEKSLGESFGKQLKDAFASLQPQAPKNEGEPAGAPKTEDKPSAQVAMLTKTVEELKARAEAAEKATQETIAKKRNDDAFASLTSALTGKVKPGTESVIAKIMRHDGILGIEEDGTPVLKFSVPQYTGGKPELTPFAISDGVAHYLKTDEAALFIDAPNGGGSGAPRRPGQLPPRGKSPDEMSNAELIALATRDAGLS